jgi:Asp-tRNA(Asn)/Glu-tRNA(Gln) amidotransferase A subunit family amidase
LFDFGYRFKIFAELGEPPRRQIAIRSRLHCKSTHPRALNNYRIVFDDMFRLQGLSDGKGLCALRSVASDSSTLVRWAVKLNGKVVGKTKVSQFNSSHKLIEDGIGAETASNCRSQRYCAFGGTSCGGAAALAAYSCLDIAVGIDCKPIKHPKQMEINSV